MCVTDAAYGGARLTSAQTFSDEPSGAGGAPAGALPGGDLPAGDLPELAGDFSEAMGVSVPTPPPKTLAPLLLLLAPLKPTPRPPPAAAGAPAGKGERPPAVKGTPLVADGPGAAGLPLSGDAAFGGDGVGEGARSADGNGRR